MPRQNLASLMRWCGRRTAFARALFRGCSRWRDKVTVWSDTFYLVDRLEGKPRKIYSLTQGNQIGSHALSRDNRRLYFTSVSSEADIWLLKVK